MTTDTTTIETTCPCCAAPITVGYVINEGVDWQEGCECFNWLDCFGDTEALGHYETQLMERIGGVGQDDFVDGDALRKARLEGVGFPGVAR